MSRLEDPEILAQITEALKEAAKGSGGYVLWKKVAWEWVAKNLEGETQQSMAAILLGYVQAGDKVDQVTERRDYDEPFHYDFRPRIANMDVYVETVLHVGRTGPTLSVVSIHLK
jgi:hypothetical protein